jgi:hypothetical protein
MVAQCLVFARNRVEALDIRHRHNGLKFSRKIQAILSSVEGKDLLLVKWDQGTLEEMDWQQGLPATLFVGLKASELLASKSNGKMEINTGYISLRLQRK